MSRGRGGGRGGGRGAMNKSFNREQLNAMGIANNEMLPTLVTQPPPLFPLMERHPIPLTPSLELDYLLILRQDFIDHMQLSPSYLKLPDSKNKQPEQEIEKLVAQLPTSKQKYDWSLFPSELRPKMLAKRIKKTQIKEVDVVERLTVLEKQEESKGTPKVKEEVVDEEAEEEVVEDEEDEEMDDGTDYANNYFDNGEGYEDEDDNLDEGPIY
ncbi:DNA-directed RNA polymerase III subunit RPC7-like [Anthonomus grandis grandis]|uniref:DNA-directed RNA polymerase III subunit RPC7-like n=1 Tax=Anthonomus grandis grandis TaxID=2921223 RepID=UPI002166B545|nr:DNA-directed RNA polymerase III subunit RPC7-like [Anthonomus grandis grandis]